MVHKPLSPGPLRLMCLRLVSQAIYNYLECRPRLEKYLKLCGPTAPSQASQLVDYVSQFLPQSLRDLLLEFLTQLWFARLLKMKQKAIEHERMSIGDPTHDHSICGGTTGVAEAQRQTALMAEILALGMTERTKSVRFGFTNARSGHVDFSRPFTIMSDRCSSLRHLDLTFATDTLLPTKAGIPSDSFNGVFAKECLNLCRRLAAVNCITSMKLLMCTKQMLREIAKCSKLQVLEIIEASSIQDSDLATFSHGEVRHCLSKLTIKFWSDTQHIKDLCETQAPRKISQGFTTNNNGKVLLPSWAVFLLNCRCLTELQWFEPSQLRPFNPMVGLLTLIREAKKWWNLEIENEGDLLDMVIEKPADLDNIKFMWTKINIEMANDGLSGSPSETALNEHMEYLASTLPSLTNLTLTLFPSPLAFLTLQGLVVTPAGRHLASRLTSLKVQACHPAHLTSARELLQHTTTLSAFTLEHLQLSQAHHHVVNLDLRDLLSWLPASVSKLKVRGFHLLRAGAGDDAGEAPGGPCYPAITSIEVVFCGASDPHLLHVCCLCPGLQHLTVVVSMTSTAHGPQGGPPQPPQQGMVASHLHSLCHNPTLVECIVLIKVGEGWIQVDDRDMLGELVLSSSSENLRKIVLFPIRGICGNGLRSLVRAAKEKNICLNIGIGNQRPVKTETNRRTATDEFALTNEDTTCQDYFNEFGHFLDKKVSEFEGQFWNDPDWFFGGVWPEQETGE